MTGASSITDWKWDFGDASLSVLRNPNHLYEKPGDHNVRLIVEDSNECKDTAMQTVNYYPVPPLLLVKPSKFSACVPEEIDFTNLSTPIDNTYNISWDFGDGGFSGVIHPTHLYTDPGVYTVKLDITSPIGCHISDVFPNLITMLASPTADFSYTPDDLNSISSSASFTALVRSF